MSEICVVANNTGEMIKAQADLVSWAESKIKVAEREVREHETVLEKLKAARLNPGPAARHTRLARRRVMYYEKISAALKAGFVIVPDMDAEIVAVRTDRDRPIGWTKSSEQSWAKPNKFDHEQPAENLPAGKGRYVNPFPITTLGVTRNEKGEEVEWTSCPNRHDDVTTLPVEFLKPSVIDRTSQAMLAGIFDEICIIGGRRKPDPMVIGKIIHHASKYKRVCFLISWFVDTAKI